jgi:putative endonuclease
VATEQTIPRGGQQPPAFVRRGGFLPIQPASQNKTLPVKFWVYLTANRPDGVIYTGFTKELKSRIQSHKTKKYPNAFSARYNADKLVYYEEYDSVIVARDREKQIKAGSRAKKVKLIESLNPDWKDLYETL